MNRKSTLKELASELELSVTTVSRALSGYPDVAEATRNRIVEAASRANYVRDSADKMLVTGRSGFVGLVLPLREPQILDPFLGEFLGGLSEGLAHRGRDLFLASAPRTQSELTVLRHVVESGRADGMVLTRIAENDERVSYLEQRSFPFITHGRVLSPMQPYSWVDTDGESAFAEACQLLYSLGHRRFGLVSITEPMTFRFFRETGLERAIADQGDADARLCARHIPRFDKAARADVITSMLAADDGPTAILAMTDGIALSVLEHAATMNIDVPRQLSVIGFDNIPAAACAPPGLTTFDQCIRETTQQLADMLLDVIDGKTEHQHRLLRPTLIRRGSHGPAPSTP